MTQVVLDASALIILLRSEPGHEAVEAAVETGEATMSAVNLAEVASKLVDEGADMQRLSRLLSGLDIAIVPFDQQLAFVAAELRAGTRPIGLSLGDRACLSLAKHLQVAALTADRMWTRTNLDVEIHVVRP